MPTYHDYQPERAYPLLPRLGFLLALTTPCLRLPYFTTYASWTCLPMRVLIPYLFVLHLPTKTLAERKLRSTNSTKRAIRTHCYPTHPWSEPHTQKEPTSRTPALPEPLTPSLPEDHTPE